MEQDAPLKGEQDIHAFDIDLVVATQPIVLYRFPFDTPGYVTLGVVC